MLVYRLARCPCRHANRRSVLAFVVLDMDAHKGAAECGPCRTHCRRPGRYRTRSGGSTTISATPAWVTHQDTCLRPGTYAQAAATSSRPATRADTLEADMPPAEAPEWLLTLSPAQAVRATRQAESSYAPQNHERLRRRGAVSRAGGTVRVPRRVRAHGAGTGH